LLQSTLKKGRAALGVKRGLKKVLYIWLKTCSAPALQKKYAA